MSLSLRAYARRRRAAGLPGGTHEAVRRAIVSGRLSAASLTADRSQIADPDLADREWAASTLEDRIPLTGRCAASPAAAPPPDVPPLHESRARREAALAARAEHELAQLRGRLIDVDAARAEVMERYALVRTRLLGIPARARQRDPSLTAAQVAMIDELLREALEELSGPTEEEPC